MNRRQLLTAIPAAVAALTDSKAIAGATSPVDASAAILEVPVPAGLSGMSMQPGVSYCRLCDADMMPVGEQMTDRHIARRFGNGQAVDIFDGDRQLLLCYEAVVGPGVWVVSGDHLTEERCSCGFNSLVEVRRGDEFRVEVQ